MPPSAASHPDPDLLTAFVERSLPERERGQVLGHLVECAECREVVVLAQPELEESSPVRVPKPVVSGGFWLRWGVLAACAVLAVTLVLRHSSEEKSPVVATQRAEESVAVQAEMSGNEATDRAKPGIAASSSQPVAKIALPPPQVSGELTRKAIRLDPPARQRATKLREDAKRAEPEASGITSSKAQAVVGALNTEAAKAASPASLADKKAEQVRSNQLTAAGPATRQREENLYSTAAGGDVSGATTQTVEVASDAAAVAAEKDKEMKDELHASSAPIAARSLSASKAVRQAALWQITAAGELQRSFDSGRKWESVSLGEPVRLRVIAMSGLHVWAGGNGGKLFHSWDGGANFIAVAVKDASAILSGDIVVLEFADSLHGRLETAHHEVWTTLDGGKTWQMWLPSKSSPDY